MSLIEFHQIAKSFGNNQILKDFDLAIEKGETLTIIGGSGTGKSVTLKLLLRLLKPDDGHIEFRGQNIQQMNNQDLIGMRKKIGMLFQGAALFDSLTVAENIAYPIHEHFRYSKTKIKKIVSEKLELVGLPGIEEMYPSDLSGGMKKRVGLARAIATDPEVILYDEPTTGLDPTNINRIDELILRMQEVLKVTSIVVTHDMQSAFRISDRVAFLYKKHIDFVGPLDRVKQGVHQELKDFVDGKLAL